MRDVYVISQSDPPTIREQALAALAGGAVVVTFRGRVVAANFAALAAAPEAVAIDGGIPARRGPAGPPAPAFAPPARKAAPVVEQRIAEIVRRLGVCRACEQYDADRSGCRLITRDTRACAAELQRRMHSGQPCPHPAGDRWSV